MSVLGPLRILLVEDDEDLAQSWQELLALDGHQVRYVLRARDVLDCPEVIASCDVLVSDYYLPDVNGLELIRRVRAVRPELPAILLTGAKEAAILERVQQLGDVLLVNKPVRVDRLEEALARVLQTNALAAS
jgi:DNA-binding NtrC family response regulator